MIFSHYINQLHNFLEQTHTTQKAGSPLELQVALTMSIDWLLETRREARKVIVVGNGGSAAIASHLHNDLSKAVGMRAMVFHETSLLTALSNDLDYQSAFEFQCNLWSDPHDLLIAISSSGQSSNILRAVQLHQARQGKVITLSGFKAENPLRQQGDINFYIPSTEYGYVELAHQVIAHYLTDNAAKTLTNQ